ncbi:MAG: hypothetical protein JWN15_263, partial [Firmicutes bacterium]|nr:hypothetical protein [Bacillota bacterium]
TPANTNGWNNGDVTVTFTCTDAGSGIATCPDPVTLTAEGTGQHTTGTATDAAGNTASVTVDAVNIDKTAPEVTFAGDRTYTIDETVTVTCTATDSLSGLAAEPCAAPLVSAPAYRLGPGTHAVSVTATDNAGNTTSAATNYTLSVTYTSLVTLINSLVPNKGLATAFEAALRAAEAADARGNTPAQNAALDAFIHQVQAQSGKALTAEQANLLAAWATALKQ